MMDQKNRTMLLVSKQTRDRMKNMASKADSFDSFVNKLMDFVEGSQQTAQVAESR